MKESYSRTCIMKIASGAMNEQEIIINIDTNLIIIGQSDTYTSNISAEGFTIYSIPSEQAPFEFSIISATSETGGEFALDLHIEGRSTIVPINSQQIVLADLFPIVIKHIDTPWEITASTHSLNEIRVDTERKPIKKTALRSKQKSIIALSLFILVFVTLFLIQHYSNITTNQKIKNLTTILQGNHYPLVITEGKNNQTLILVKTQLDFDWSMQRLLKSQYHENFSIKKIDQLESEIENKLIESIPAVLKLDINDPCNPVIKVLSKNISSNENKIIKEILSNYFTCYSNGDMKYIKFDDLLKKAELGLTESNVKWHKINKDNKVIYMIKDSLNDKQTLSLISFTSQFYQQWGDKHIQFSVSLANNELAGKSFITDGNGYIILGNNHWLFNSNKLNTLN